MRRLGLAVLAAAALATTAAADTVTPPASMTPVGTVTLTDRWTAAPSTERSVQHKLTGLCQSTLTYDGGKDVQVEETFLWSERRVQKRPDGSTDVETMERRGDYEGTIPSRGDHLDFTASGYRGKPSYAFAFTTPQDTIPVEETSESVHTAPRSEPVRQSSRTSFRFNCWRPETPTSVGGRAPSYFGVSGSRKGTNRAGTESDQLLHWVLTWRLSTQPAACPKPQIPVDEPCSIGANVRHQLLVIRAKLADWRKQLATIKALYRTLGKGAEGYIDEITNKVGTSEVAAEDRVIDGEAVPGGWPALAGDGSVIVKLGGGERPAVVHLYKLPFGRDYEKMTSVQKAEALLEQAIAVGRSAQARLLLQLQAQGR